MGERTWDTGTGVPSNSTGSNGDVSIRTVTHTTEWSAAVDVAEVEYPTQTSTHYQTDIDNIHTFKMGTSYGYLYGSFRAGLYIRVTPTSATTVNVHVEGGCYFENGYGVDSSANSITIKCTTDTSILNKSRTGNVFHNNYGQASTEFAETNYGFWREDLSVTRGNSNSTLSFTVTAKLDNSSNTSSVTISDVVIPAKWTPTTYTTNDVYVKEGGT